MKLDERHHSRQEEEDVEDQVEGSLGARLERSVQEIAPHVRVLRERVGGKTRIDAGLPSVLLCVRYRGAAQRGDFETERVRQAQGEVPQERLWLRIRLRRRLRLRPRLS